MTKWMKFNKTINNSLTNNEVFLHKNTYIYNCIYLEAI